MESDYSPILSDQRFEFSCTPKNSCFNQCCRDLNQLLTPYDILRLKNRLGLSSTEFLKHHADIRCGAESGLPVVVLKPAERGSDRCPFVAPGGCSVYADRPSSCRMYPLMRVVSRSRATGRISEKFLLLKEAHCRGFREGRRWTPETWQDAQGLRRYNAMNDRLLEIIGLKNRQAAGALAPQLRQQFTLALYDLDRFRSLARDGNLPAPEALLPEAPGRLEQCDDETLLSFGFSYIRQAMMRAS